VSKKLHSYLRGAKRKTTLQPLVKLTNPITKAASTMSQKCFKNTQEKICWRQQKTGSPLQKVQTASAKTSLQLKQTIRRSTVSVNICTTY